MIFLFFLNFRFISTEHDSISSFNLQLPEITSGEIITTENTDGEFVEDYPDEFYEDYTQDLPEDFPELQPALLPGFFTEIFPEDFLETLPVESSEYVTEIFPDYNTEEFYDDGDWWNDYYDNLIYTYFDDYNYVSRDIHDRILDYNSNDGLDIHRAGSNETLNINFQLFIKDVTNLQQEDIWKL